MKSVFPKTKVEWMQLILFPFKCCIFLIPLAFIVLFIGTGTTSVDRMPILLIEDQLHLMVAGYIVCIIVLAIGGIYAAVSMRNWKLMRSGLIYAGIGLFLWSVFILPSLAASRS
jgi:hypothetical protein